MVLQHTPEQDASSDPSISFNVPDNGGGDNPFIDNQPGGNNGQSQFTEQSQAMNGQMANGTGQDDTIQSLQTQIDIDYEQMEQINRAFPENTPVETDIYNIEPTSTPAAPQTTPASIIYQVGQYPPTCLAPDGSLNPETQNAIMCNPNIVRRVTGDQVEVVELQQGQAPAVQPLPTRTPEVGGRNRGRLPRNVNVLFR